MITIGRQHRTSCLLKIYLIVSLGTVLDTFGQSYPPIVYDKLQSEHFGAYNLISLQKCVYSFQDRNIPDTLFAENNFLNKTLGFGYRMGKLFILDFQEDYFIALLQHEAFGHGARYREFGHEDNSFHFSLFFPFGNGSGFASSGNLKEGEIITPHESITKVFSGNEANLVLANTLSAQFLLNDTIHFRQALLYLITQNNQFVYIWSTRLNPSDPTFESSNDIGAYIDGVNALYDMGSSKRYDINQLSIQSLISLANPLQLYSLYTLLFQYGIKSQKHLPNIPMIKIGNTRYLPLFNYNLTPFGSEYQFSNIIRHKQRLYNVDLSLGDKTFNNFYCGTIKIFNVIDNQKIGININGSFWNQPQLELENPSVKNTTNKNGGCIRTDLNFRPLKLKNKLGLFFQAGYKTKGYLMGESLSETLILRFGISLH